jgi:hypothetical protein
MENFNDQYQHLISPPIFMNNFKNKDEFVSWLELGTIKDLQETLKAFLIYKMHDQVFLINQVIDKKNHE